MNADSLGIGDVVKLNSGSPDLMVMEIVGEKVTVEWSQPPQVEAFPAACLTLVRKGTPDDALALLRRNT